MLFREIAENKEFSNYLLLAICASAIALLLPPGIASATVLGIGFVLLIFLNQHIGVLAIVFTRFSQLFVSLPISPLLSINKLIAVVLLFGIALIYFIKKTREFWLPRQMVFLSGFLAIAVISSIVNNSGIDIVFYIINQVILLATIFYRTTKKNHVANIYALLCIIVVIFYLSVVFEGKTLQSLAEGTSIIENRNGVAATVAFVAPIAFVLAVRQKIRFEKYSRFAYDLSKKIFFIAVIFLVVLITAATLSRGVLIALVASFAIIFKKLPKEKIWIWFALSLAIFFLLYGSFITKITERFEEVEKIPQVGTITGAKEEVQDSGITRTLAAIETFTIFLTNPLLGIGLGNSPPALGTILPQKFQKDPLSEELSEKHMLDPHNIYLEVLAETGIFGFIFYMLFLAQNLFDSMKTKQLFKQKNDTEGLLLTEGIQTAYISTIIMGFFFNDPFFFHIIISSALIISLKKISIDEEKR